MTTPNLGTAPAVAFVASGEFIAALERAAAQQGQTRSHYARHVLAQHLRAAGLFPEDGAVTHHEARHRRSRSTATA